MGYAESMACPTEDTLLAVAEGRFPGDTSATYEHVESCPSCRELFNEVARSYGREQDQLRLGQRVGRYELRALIGMGGMGVVYAAYDPDLERDVAIKLLRHDVDSLTHDLHARLMREAQAMARLSHPNVIAVYDVGLHDDQVFIAMELIDGQTLRQWLAEKPRTWREVLAVMLRAGRGLAAAHEVGIVHRDFKPDNVMLARNGSVRVLDFGLARAVAGVAPPATRSPSTLTRSLTGEAGMVGTPAYMSPEQLTARAIDARTDQFSFCVALYEALSGARPFTGASPQQLLDAIEKGRKESLAEARIPSWLRPIITRGMQADPEARFPALAALLAELERDPRAAWRRRILAVAALLVVATVGAIGYYGARRRASLVCRGAEARLADAWDPAWKERIRTAFAATSVPYAQESFATTARVLDSYAGQWKAMHIDACLATRVRGEQSEDLLDLRMSCLDQAHDELKALTDLFTSADAKTVQRAAQAAYSLADLSQCANTAALKAPIPPPRDPQARGAVEKLRTRLAQVYALRDAGKFQEGLRAIAPMHSDARALAYPPLAAEALLLEGQIQQSLSHGHEAEASLRRALVAAAEGHDEGATVKGACSLVFTTGYLLDRHEEARFWGDLALASMRRLGGNNDIQLASCLNGIAAVAVVEGKGDEAVALARRSVELNEKNRPDSPQLARALRNLSQNLAGIERYEEALAVNRRAIAISTHSQGANHPDMTGMLQIKGVLLNKLGRYAEAVVVLRGVVADFERELGANNLQTAMAYSNLTDAYLGSHDYEQARASGHHAVQIVEKLDSGTRLVVGVYEAAGKAELAAGGPEAALLFLEHGLALAQSGEGGPATDLAETKFLVAQALWQSHGDRQRALVLARQARALYAAAPHDQEALAETDTWLATHQN
jgi:tetratricopeptide (TPR) repeat protein